MQLIFHVRPFVGVPSTPTICRTCSNAVPCHGSWSRRRGALSGKASANQHSSGAEITRINGLCAVVILSRTSILLGKALQFENQIREDRNIDRQGEGSTNAHPPGHLIDFDRQQR
jgi:hypothetical protein